MSGSVSGTTDSTLAIIVRRTIQAILVCGEKKEEQFKSKVMFLVSICLRNMHETLTLGPFLYHVKCQLLQDVLEEDG